MATMTRSEAKEYIELHPEEYLERDRSGKGWICPICGSGSGSNGTGITTKDGRHYTCWGAGSCFTNSDLFDIIGIESGISPENFPAKLEKAAEIYDITLVNDTDPVKRRSPEQDFSDLGSTGATETESGADYTSYFLQAAERIEETDYRRGISLDTLKKYCIGYDPEWKIPLSVYLARDGKNTESKWKYIPTTPRLIIPTSRFSYIARYTGEGKYIANGTDYTKQKIGKVHLFNDKVINEDKPIFIVEGELDALSIIDAGGMAIGLGSISNRGMLINLLKEGQPKYPLILALDNDESGQKAAADIEKSLQGISVPFVFFRYPDGCKDANDALNADRGQFEQAIKEAEARAIQKAEEKNTEDLIELERDSNAAAITGFLDRINESKKIGSSIPTGFPALDDSLEGGLYPGLYVIGAVSSLGKTSFCLQVADQIAKSGRDVLVFSLEMSRDELIAKSISRITYQIDMSESRDHKRAKTTLGILVGKRYDEYRQEDLDLIADAVEEYKQDYASHLYIHEGMGNLGVKEVREQVERIKRIKGIAPVVLIDYLQILAPCEGMERSSDKQICDKNVLELKRLSRDYKIPVIGISSFNRDNYNSPVNLTAFKESGAIEYGSDVLLGMQYRGFDDLSGNASNSDRKEIKAIHSVNSLVAKDGGAFPVDLKILKNRNGNRGEVELWFCPMFNCYSEKPLSLKGSEDYSNLLEQEKLWNEPEEEKKADPVKKKRSDLNSDLS